GRTLQLTALFHVPATTAVNCWLSEGPRVAVAGVTETVAVGTRLMVAMAVLPLAARAVRVTVCAVKTDAGAVQRPDDEIEPTPAGLSDQVTVAGPTFATAAVNCWVWPPTRFVDNGDRTRACGGYRLIVAVWDELELAGSVAVRGPDGKAVIAEGQYTNRQE